ncbi:MAG TPA: T9SS type A sorting domain-containing protein [Flavobacterium sp.]|uniref:T9SS type A sorting domain-containing protein n=1 Tax=unclassified Flavobacterium TaxID=196869 RepID=UPI000E85C97E|nr:MULTISPECIES: T9SS type A sorting domain-containing protein [unclassified Flavobacterium]HBI01727.1 hypothetical protein [Flavobacterium sp.]HRE78295.1 T9SS type A sorting domain-containing protein [Flavobacterium sp.]
MKRNITLLCLLAFPFWAFAQLGTIDPNFAIGTGAGITFTQKRVETIVQQPDGKLLLGGWFSEFNGTESRRIVRLNLDGSVDTSFNVGVGFNGTSPYVNAITLQPDGKILVGGNFSDYKGVTRHRIARLNPDGSLDTSFNPLTGFDSDVNSIALQSDGKIVVGGIFSKFDWLNQGGINRQAIARLNSDGSLDTSFDSATGFTSTAGQNRIHTVIVQPNGKILCGGLFTAYKSVSRILLARLNEDASLDTTFDAGNNFSLIAGFYGEAWETVLLPNGQIITAGNFRHTGANNKAIVKLNSDGSVDTSLALDLSNVTAMTVQSDGKILASAGGPYTFRRYLENGAVDTSFPETSFNDWARHCIVQNDGNIVIGGWFSYNPSGLMRVVGDTPNLNLSDETSLNTVKIYPNPTSDMLYIDLAETPNFSQATLTLVDVQGRKVSEHILSNSVTPINTDHLPKGLYIATINMENAQLTKKIVIQ